MYNVGQMTAEEKTCSDLLMNTNVIPSLRSLEDLCQDHSQSQLSGLSSNFTPSCRISSWRGVSRARAGTCNQQIIKVQKHCRCQPWQASINQHTQAWGIRINTCHDLSFVLTLLQRSQTNRLIVSFIFDLTQLTLGWDVDFGLTILELLDLGVLSNIIRVVSNNMMHEASLFSVQALL